MSHEVSQFNSEQNSIALNNASITGGGKMSDKHTPGKLVTSGCAIYSEENQLPICIASGPATLEERIANMRHLVKCWNSHDALLEALRRLTIRADTINAIQHAGCEVPAMEWSMLYQESTTAKAAIAQAEKEG